MQRVDIIRDILKTLTGPIDREHYNKGMGRAIADCDAVATRIDDAIEHWESWARHSKPR